MALNRQLFREARGVCDELKQVLQANDLVGWSEGRGGDPRFLFRPIKILFLFQRHLHALLVEPRF